MTTEQQTAVTQADANIQALIEKRVPKGMRPGYVTELVWEAIAMDRLASQADTVTSHEVDADGKPTEDSDPWFQLGWHKERLEWAETELATWKERAMSLRVPAPAEPVGLREVVTDEMLDAGGFTIWGHKNRARWDALNKGEKKFNRQFAKEVWHAMLATHPQPSQKGEGDA